MYLKLRSMLLPALALATASGLATADTLTLDTSASITLIGTGSVVRGDRLDMTTFNGTNSLIRFDTSGLSILDGATINSVTLDLTMQTTNTTSSNVAFEVRQLVAANSGWLGTTAGYTGTSTVASGAYKNQPTTTPWASNGPITDPANFSTTVYNGNIVPGTYTANQTYNFTLDNSLITGWLGNASLASAGIGLFAPTGQYTTFTFQSIASATPGFRPTISIDYTPVPEPATYALLIGAATIGLAICRRRKCLRS